MTSVLSFVKDNVANRRIRLNIYVKQLLGIAKEHSHQSSLLLQWFPTAD